MATGALPSRAHRAGTSAGLVAIMALAAVGGGVYIATHRSEPPPAVQDDRLAEIAALARVEKDTEWIQRAIRERHAILGMTYREVETARGLPQRILRDDALSEIHRAKGAVENWVYEREGGEVASVLFGSNGLVIHSSDVGETPRPGQAVRQ